MVLEMLYIDYGAHGPFTIVFGKGLNVKEFENLPTPIMVVGPCAVDETGEFPKEKYGKKNVVLVNYCNDLAMITNTLLEFSGIGATRVVPLNPIKGNIFIVAGETSWL